MSGAYDDIINLPHHVSDSRAHMSMYDRAAQFAPFAALSGYEDAVKETARLTTRKTELEDYAREQLNAKLTEIFGCEADQAEYTVTYFKPDENKSGGAYIDVSGKIVKIDSFNKLIKMSDGTIIPIDDVYNIE